MAERYRKYRDVYRSFMQPDDFYIVNSILDFLHQYERGQRATYSHAIHGDPVFSNILLKADNSVSVPTNMLRLPVPPRGRCTGDVLREVVIV